MNKAGLTVLCCLLSLTVLAQKQRVRVAQDGSGDYKTVQAALNTIPANNKSRIVIYIKKGIYKEKLRLDSTQHMVTMIGEDKASTILTYDDYSGKTGPDGVKLRTYSSSSFSIFGDDFRAENLTFENTAGSVGQAVAAYVTGDRSVFINCRFLGFQDTLYTGMPGQYGRQYYKNCYVEGTIDFIFGSATAVFDQCTIFSKTADTYVTAASTPEGKPFGFVFLNCTLTSDVSKASVYLGRPWRDFAKTVFVNCQLGGHIRPEGWHNWDKPNAERTVFYAEYQSRGPGASPASRVGWTKQLTAGEARSYKPESILAGNDGWKPKL
ncbi:pectinesterase family protein [Spirosoma validum]|uniref:Pectinesterase n=1 Tax=Spirosoma validum TaxID=2771355 RepID=A0A927B832_9BACT|nr:pectinesterase family protein [Spirosoma validum]MBD2757445.1 pectin esterase [Spirosoma validum]